MIDFEFHYEKKNCNIQLISDCESYCKIDIVMALQTIVACSISAVEFFFLFNFYLFLLIRVNNGKFSFYVLALVY